MIAGFHIETQPLTEAEKNVLPFIIQGLSKMVGVKNAITNKTICTKLLEKRNVQISEARMRKIINHIRMKNLLPGLIATSKGYYISKNPKEIKEYIDSLEGRKNAIDGVAKQFKKYLFEITTMPQNKLYNQ